MDEIVVFVTCASEEEAEKIARVLLEKQLAACVNMLPSITSLFSWEGKIHREKEVLMIAKSRKNIFKLLEKTIKKNHSYAVPEIIALPIIEGSKDYLDWIKSNTLSDKKQ